MNQHIFTPITLLNGNPKASAQIQTELRSKSTTNMANFKEKKKGVVINSYDIYDFIYQRASLALAALDMRQNSFF